MAPRAARQEQRCCRKAQHLRFPIKLKTKNQIKILNIDIISNIDSVILGIEKCQNTSNKNGQSGGFRLHGAGSYPLNILPLLSHLPFSKFNATIE